MTRSRTRQILLAAAALAVAVAAVALMALGFPHWATGAFTVGALALLLILAFMATAEALRRRPNATAQSAPVASAADAAEATPRRLAEARARAAERRAKGGSVKVKVRRG